RHARRLREAARAAHRRGLRPHLHRRTARQAPRGGDEAHRRARRSGLPVTAVRTARGATAASQLNRSTTAELEATVERLLGEGVDVCRLGLGEPDIVVPPHVRDAAIRAIEENFSHYTSTAGIAPLRSAI